MEHTRHHGVNDKIREAVIREKARIHRIHTNVCVSTYMLLVLGAMTYGIVVFVQNVDFD